MIGRLATTALAGILLVVANGPTTSAAANDTPNPQVRPAFTLAEFRAGRVHVEGLSQSLFSVEPEPRIAQLRAVPIVDGSSRGEAISVPYDGYRVATRTLDPSNAPSAVFNIETIADGYMAAATADYVDLSWATAKPGTKFVILRDRTPIASITGDSYRDSAVSPGNVYHYQVQAVLPPSRTAPNDPASQPAPQQGIEYGFVAVTPASSMSNGAIAAASRQNALINAATIQQTGRVSFRAFIPEATIGLPPGVGPAVCSNYSLFSGDNRGFTVDVNASVRVSDDATILWDTKSVSHNPRVGATHALSSTGTVLATRTAAFQGSTYYHSATTSSVTFIQSIKAGNPFCGSAAGYIYGTQTINITRAGNYSTTGWVKKMPNTEIYYVFATSSGYYYWTVLQFTYTSPACLIDYIPFCTANF